MSNRECYETARMLRAAAEIAKRDARRRDKTATAAEKAFLIACGWKHVRTNPDYAYMHWEAPPGRRKRTEVYLESALEAELAFQGWLDVEESSDE